MKRLLIIIFVLLSSLIVGASLIGKADNSPKYGAPPYIADANDESPFGLERFPDILNWKRPDGPLRVGLQVGHWKNSELPEELKKIRGNSGASNKGVAEWEVNLAIALETKSLLEKEGIMTDILPATVPPSYWADAFVAIHADGSESPTTNGFKVAAPRRDYTHRASDLVTLLEQVYAEEVGSSLDPNVTKNMRGYYAFSWWRFIHSVHPMTPSVILETGFLTNPKEAKLLIDHPEIPAQAIAKALITFLKP